MDKIWTDRMNPAFPPALREQMILAVVINQSIHVIDPALLFRTGIQSVHRPLARSEVKLRAQRFLIKRPGRHRQTLRFIGLDDVIHIDVPPITPCLVNNLHLRLLPPEMAHIPTRRH